MALYAHRLDEAHDLFLRSIDAAGPCVHGPISPPTHLPFVCTPSVAPMRTNQTQQPLRCPPPSLCTAPPVPFSLPSGVTFAEPYIMLSQLYWGHQYGPNPTEDSIKYLNELLVMRSAKREFFTNLGLLLYSSRGKGESTGRRAPLSCVGDDEVSCALWCAFVVPASRQTPRCWRRPRS
jgi:hypothetical protein